MKLLYRVTTYVEAESAEEAMQLAKEVKPHEAIIYHAAWEYNNSYQLKDEE